MTRPLPLHHLEALTDRRGLFEHARGATPRPEFGYCLDDAARALIVTVREDAVSATAQRLAGVYLDVVDGAVTTSGRAHNRLDGAGRWVDNPGRGDWWGRALRGLGAAATASADAAVRDRARAVFGRAARASLRGTSLRTAAFAMLGAAALVGSTARSEGADAATGADPSVGEARRLLEDGIAIVDAPASASWLWPEDRLTYANAVIPHALLAAGGALRDDTLVRHGLELLDFLLEVETLEGHLSLTPTGGRRPGDPAPAFDQQPIEAWAIAEASAMAFDLTAEGRWRDAVRRAWAWFAGDNDVGIPLFDPATGAGYDGLTPDGRNDNRGAESTISALGTLQCARRLGVASRPRVLGTG
jgi:hypothetical protein